MSEQYDLKKIAALSQLEFSDEELTDLEPIVEKIIDYFNLLSEVHIDENASCDNQEHQVIFHEDDQEPIEIAPNSFSPYVEENYFKTPKIVE